MRLCLLDGPLLNINVLIPRHDIEMFHPYNVLKTKPEKKMDKKFAQSVNIVAASEISARPSAFMS